MRREIVIVLYHHIAEDDDALTNQIGVTTKPDVFQDHVRYFARNFELVSAADIVNGSLPRRALLITFDDAYRSVVSNAAGVLKSAAAPSVFFINPATVAATGLPIDNILSLAFNEIGQQRVSEVMEVDNSEASTATRLIADIVSKLNQPQVTRVKRALCVAMGTTETEIRRGSRLFLEADDIQTLSDHGMEVGNHSMNHTFFRSLSPDELETEIVDSRRLLEEMSGRSVPYLSIPYGNMLDATSGALAAARRGGHKAIFLVHAKSNRCPPAPDIFYRISLGNAPIGNVPLKLRLMPNIRSLRDLW